jgi:hypothetical protein
MAAKTRPRPWCPLDREFLTQDTVRELGERFGAAGPLVFLALVLEAGKRLAGTAPGVVEMRFNALARLAFSEPQTVQEVVTAAAEVGLLADLEGDGERFKARLTRFEAWETKDPSGAERSARYRASKAAEQEQETSP